MFECFAQNKKTEILTRSELTHCKEVQVSHYH
jgi:hypothetical protein